MTTGSRQPSGQATWCLSHTLVRAAILAPSGAEPSLENCVRAPWAYYHLSHNLAGGANAASDYGNESLPTLTSLTNDSGQWTKGSWVGDGVQRGLYLAWGSDPLGADAVASTGTGALMIGVAIFHPLAAVSTETIVSAGTRSGTVGNIVDNRLELKINGNGRASTTVFDDQGISVSATVNQPGAFAAGPDAPPAALFIYIDNRPDGDQTISLHQYELGTTNRVSKVQSIASLGAITGGPLTRDKVLSVGFSRNIGGETFRHFNGEMRGLHVLNFGQRPPADIDVVMDGMARTGMLPARFMVGL